MKADAGMIESPFPTILVLLHSGELYMVASSPVLHSSYGFEYMPGVEWILHPRGDQQCDQ
jgi:hypothetical protein